MKGEKGKDGIPGSHGPKGISVRLHYFLCICLCRSYTLSAKYQKNGLFIYDGLVRSQNALTAYPFSDID